MINWKKSGKMEKFNFSLNVVILTTLIIAFWISVYKQNWTEILPIILTFTLLLIPHFLEKKYKIDFPTEFEIAIAIIIYCSLFLGEYTGAYQTFWWWDSFLHAFSGLTLGLAAFLTMYLFYKTEKIKAKPITIAIIAFSFALSIGALWEIAEFTIDYTTGMDMQRARNLCEIGTEICDTRLGVMDTMKDLIVDSIGALIASIIGFIYLKTGEIHFIENIIRKTIRTNKRFFK